MPKARFTSLDIRCIVKDLDSKIKGMRLANVYDYKSKAYVLKFASANNKFFVILQSGIRIHTTKYSSQHKDVPSIFTFKLRRALRTKLLRSIVQIGFDRVIDLTFGMGEYENHIICEFYAGGNIILTDGQYKILALLRTYRQEHSLYNVMLHATYSTQPQQLLRLPSRKVIEESLEVALKNKPSTLVSDLITRIFPIGYEATEHVLSLLKLPEKCKASQFDASLIDQVISYLNEFENFIQNDQIHPGYLLCVSRAEKKTNMDHLGQVGEKDSGLVANEMKKQENHSQVVVYDGFFAFPFHQLDQDNLLKVNDFDTAVDEYYAKMEQYQIDKEKHTEARESIVRLDKVRGDNVKRMENLGQVSHEKKTKALLIEQHVDEINQIIGTINGYLAHGITWSELSLLIKQERKKGNPLTLMINQICLERNRVILMLFDLEKKIDLINDELAPIDEDKDGNDGDRHDEDHDDIRETALMNLVEIDLAQSAFSNARQYYVEAKKASEKQQKTIEISNTALKRARRKIYADQKLAVVKAGIVLLRKPFWFEKFHWFISSDGYVVISGRDVQQNELLYKRYLSKGDIYLHADMHGASTCIIKNPSGEPVPPKTLNESGTWSICFSSCWKNKIVSSAWWVYENQVSKTAPTGEYLTSGSFMIRGKKNMLSPSELVMGFGILFRLAQESVTENGEDKWQPDSTTVDLDIDDDHQLQQGKEDIGSQDGQIQEEEGDDNDDENQSGHDIESMEKMDEPLLVDFGSSIPELENDAKLALLAHQDSTLSPNVHATLPTVLVSQSISGSSNCQESSIKNHLLDEKTVLNHSLPAQASSLTLPILSDPKPPTELSICSRYSSIIEKLPYRKRQLVKKRFTQCKNRNEEEVAAMLESMGIRFKTPSVNPAVLEKEKKAQEMAERDKQRQAARLATRQIQLAKEKADEEIRILFKEEKLEQLSQHDLIKLNERTVKGLGINLSELTAYPKQDDVLLYAMAICGPYDAFSNHKYHVKLTPGTSKKSKNIKSVIQAFLHIKESTPRERELIKAIPDDELSLIMMANAKLHLPSSKLMSTQSK